MSCLLMVKNIPEDKVGNPPSSLGVQSFLPTRWRAPVLIEDFENYPLILNLDFHFQMENFLTRKIFYQLKTSSRLLAGLRRMYQISSNYPRWLMEKCSWLSSRTDCSHLHQDLNSDCLHHVWGSVEALALGTRHWHHLLWVWQRVELEMEYLDHHQPPLR